MAWRLPSSASASSSEVVNGIAGTAAAVAAATGRQRVMECTAESVATAQLVDEEESDLLVLREALKPAARATTTCGRQRYSAWLRDCCCCCGGGGGGGGVPVGLDW